MEQTKQTIRRVFDQYNLKITIEANKKTVNFLDVTFNLTLGTYKPYSKPNTTHLVDKCFPKDGPLGKLFNRNTVKISYRTAPNMKQIISGHNKKILSQHTDKPQPRACSCPKNTTCPLEGKCLSKNLIYHATVTENYQRKCTNCGTICGTDSPPIQEKIRKPFKVVQKRKLQY